MKLLILTQAVDLDDPVLGFFHRWIAEFAARCERTEVVCLKEGRHSLPANVRVHSLGKEGGVSRIKYLLRFYRYAWSLRREYDAVFVHMNEEYVLLGGLFWRLTGKRVVLWRNHLKGSFRTRIAALLAHAVCYTSDRAYVARCRNAAKMPIGIDTEAFIPGTPAAGSVLFFGRLDPVKKPEVFVRALDLLSREEVSFSADIYGDPTPGHEKFAHDVRNEAAVLALSGALLMHPGVPHEKAPAVYAAHEMYVNLTPSGSFDKTIGEAMACGCIPVVANDAVFDLVPPKLRVRDATPRAAASALREALSMPQAERMRLRESARRYVLERHSLKKTVARCVTIANGEVISLS